MADSFLHDEVNNPDSDILSASLSNAFGDPNIPRRSLNMDTPPSNSESSSDNISPMMQTAPTSPDYGWKEEYETHLAGWKAESAVQREKAEKQRAEWAEKRKEEEEEEEEEERLKRNQDAKGEVGWEAVDTLASEGSRRFPSSPGAGTDVPSQDQTTYSHILRSEFTSIVDFSDTGDMSRTWQEVPSTSSSFPSLEEAVSHSSQPHNTRSFRCQPPPASGLEKAREDKQPQPPPSVTVAAFGSAPLSTRARTLALLSSVGINLLLPFINGVMLGFGEIFARNVVGPFFGWKAPGGAATAVGLRAAPPKSRN